MERIIKIDRSSRRFCLLGEKGAVVFSYRTRDDWSLEAVDLGYHAYEPFSSHQAEYGSHECDVLPTGKCYYDGSTGGAICLLSDFRRGGYDPEVVWGALERTYVFWFGPDDPTEEDN